MTKQAHESRQDSGARISRLTLVFDERATESRFRIHRLQVRSAAFRFPLQSARLLCDDVGFGNNNVSSPPRPFSYSSTFSSADDGARFAELLHNRHRGRYYAGD